MSLLPTMTWLNIRFPPPWRVRGRNKPRFSGQEQGGALPSPRELARRRTPPGAKPPRIKVREQALDLEIPAIAGLEITLARQPLGQDHVMRRQLNMVVRHLADAPLHDRAAVDK